MDALQFYGIDWIATVSGLLGAYFSWESKQGRVHGFHVHEYLLGRLWISFRQLCGCRWKFDIFHITHTWSREMDQERIRGCWS